MKPADFHYHAPATLNEALALLAEYGGHCKILAGGQSLVPAMAFRLARPAILIDINNIGELDYVRLTANGLVIGALSRHATFHKPVVAGPVGEMLAKVVHNIAHYPIRQRGTFGGSLAHADPASEWCLVTTTLGTAVVVRGSKGERVIPASSFFKGTFTTALQDDEILCEIRLQLLPEGWTTGFYEFSRRAGDFALASALAALRLEGGRVVEARLGVGAVSDRAIRLTALEQELVGQSATLATFTAIGAKAKAMIEPTEDIHGSSEYRSDLIATVVQRALTQAAA